MISIAHTDDTLLKCIHLELSCFCRQVFHSVLCCKRSKFSSAMQFSSADLITVRSTRSLMSWSCTVYTVHPPTAWLQVHFGNQVEILRNSEAQRYCSLLWTTYLLYSTFRIMYSYCERLYLSCCVCSLWQDDKLVCILCLKMEIKIHFNHFHFQLPAAQGKSLRIWFLITYDWLHFNNLLMHQ